MRAFYFKGVIFISMKYPYSNNFMSDNDFVSLLNESCACGASDDGLEMLMQNLAKIHEYSGELMGLLGRESEIEDWVEDKLSKAAQSMADVKHYAEYKNSAYSSHMHSIDSHGGDVQMGQRDSVSGRMPGERMPIMSQVPAMTPQSSMEGSSDMGQDGGDELSVTAIALGSSEVEDEPMDGPEAEGMLALPGDESGPSIEPTTSMTDEFGEEGLEDEEEPEGEEDDMSVVSLAEVWINNSKEISESYFEVSRDQAMLKLKEHGIVKPKDIRMFLESVGDRTYYQNNEVLDWIYS